MIYLLLILSFMPIAHGESFTTAQLISFSDKHSFKDNRKAIKANKMFSAYKGKDPWILIQGFNGVDQFKQVAIICDQCGTQEVTKEQVHQCAESFNQLYEHLSGVKFSQNAEEILNSKNAILDNKESKFKLRADYGALKCDGKGGARLRIDFFSK